MNIIYCFAFRQCGVQDVNDIPGLIGGVLSSLGQPPLPPPVRKRKQLRVARCTFSCTQFISWTFCRIVVVREMRQKVDQNVMYKFADIWQSCLA
jgi:hypothetical protein